MRLYRCRYKRRIFHFLLHIPVFLVATFRRYCSPIFLWEKRLHRSGTAGPNGQILSAADCIDADLSVIKLGGGHLLLEWRRSYRLLFHIGRSDFIAPDNRVRTELNYLFRFPIKK